MADKSDSDDAVQSSLRGWAVVANVVGQVPQEDIDEHRVEGTRHFSLGTKVWILPAQWGDGWENVLLVGRHRGSRRYVQMVLPLQMLADFRVEGVYSPAVHRSLTMPWDPERGIPRQWCSREEATRAIAAHPETSQRLKL